MDTKFNFQDLNGPVPAHKHPNGGGWVADTASVSETAYVGPNARVYDNAAVYGKAAVYDNARVYGNAVVYSNARVYGNAVVDSARIYGSARVYDNARVYGNAVVYSNAVVYNNAVVKRGHYTAAPISIARSDSYTFTLQSDGSIVAGCRDFTPEEADAYWGNPKHHKHAESMAIVNALRAIDASIKEGQDDE